MSFADLISHKIHAVLAEMGADDRANLALAKQTQVHQWTKQLGASPVVQVTPEALARAMEQVLPHQNREMSGYARLDDGLLTDIEFAVVGTSGGVNTADTEAATDAAGRMIARGNRPNVQAHTHANFDAFFSSTDEGDQEKTVGRYMALKAEGITHFLVIGNVVVDWLMRTVRWTRERVRYMDYNLYLGASELAKQASDLGAGHWKQHQGEWVPAATRTHVSGQREIPYWSSVLQAMVTYQDTKEFIQVGQEFGGLYLQAIVDTILSWGITPRQLLLVRNWLRRQTRDASVSVLDTILWAVDDEESDVELEQETTGLLKS